MWTPRLNLIFTIPVVGSFPIEEVIFHWFLGKPSCRKHCVWINVVFIYFCCRMYLS